MHPALSVIFFTTLTGAGYGLLAPLCALAATGVLPAERSLGIAGFLVAFAAITAGLLTSTYHLGHPGRAWRAFSQWRSSWLSREGVLAVLTYLPAGWFAKGWVWDGAALADEPWRYFGLAAAALAVLTVAATAMIYVALKPVPHWRNPWVLPGYLLLGAATGGIVLDALLYPLGLAEPRIVGAVLLAMLAAWLVKLCYWRSIDRRKAVSTAESATGLGSLGPVRLLEAPHVEENYVMREMGHRIARKHAQKLRRLALLAGIAVPLPLTVASLVLPYWAATATAVLAVPVAILGVLIERWLFFAEAQHVVTLYYGAQRV